MTTNQDLPTRRDMRIAIEEALLAMPDEWIADFCANESASVEIADYLSDAIQRIMPPLIED